MKKELFFTLVSLALLCGCSTVTKFNHAQQKLDKTQAALSTTDNQRLSAIGKWSYATDIALDATNTAVAKETNSRVQSLANAPSVEDIRQMQAMVGQLGSNNTAILTAQDAKLIALQNSVSALQKNLDEQTAKQLKQGQANTAELSTYKGWFGLKAIFQGGKHMVLWVIIGGIPFFILKVASTTSPIAGSIFSVFEGLGAMVIKGTSSLIGNGATEAASLVGAKYKDTLATVTQSIETLKAQQAGGKAVTLQDVLNQFNSDMDDSHKQVIQEVKQ